LNDDEIIEIIRGKFPIFSASLSNERIAEHILDIYRSFYSNNNDDDKMRTVFVKESRILSLRDLLKLCERLDRLLSDSTRDQNQEKIIHVLKDIYECFVYFISNKQLREELAVQIGARFNLNKSIIVNNIITSKPDFEHQRNQIVCGRVLIKLTDKLQNENINLDDNKAVFVYTKAALSLLERISRCIECNEPVLLCGETGVGKTSSLQHLARLLGKTITIINLNHQTETSDLLGSFKPVDVKYQMKSIKDKFIQIFSSSFSLKDNEQFLNHINNCYSTKNWKYLMRLIVYATDQSVEKFKNDHFKVSLYRQWFQFKQFITKVDANLDKIIQKFTFQFFEGALTRALTQGEWIILDEINLASAEALQFLSSLLDDTSSRDSSIILYERGSDEPLIRHPNFRLFAAMNPASDIGKRNLPSNIRNRFTELFVDEVDDENDLNLLIRNYLHNLTDVTQPLVKSIINFYLQLKKNKNDFTKQLSNGIGAPPINSLRQLCRALKYASHNYCNNTAISIFDGLLLSFLTDLNRESTLFLEDYIKKCIFTTAKSLKSVGKIQRMPPLNTQFNSNLEYIKIEDFWLIKGQNEIKDSINNDNKYVFTKSIEDNLKRIVRVCSARLPCLIQGDTSIGKTSLIKWLSQATGNVLIRINNHDHTDLQEYIGNYVIEHSVNEQGDEDSSKLVFKEGLLVKAMRNGYWILLDELNLASSEVLESLNRVLDDNRELYIPETQELIKAHPRFCLFATQNPPGKYAGRKQLSRAFRNRFIELHFEELPDDELQVIIEKKCNLPASYAHLLINTVRELKTKRSTMGGIFLGKHSLITLRDLFRWAKRYSAIECLKNDQKDEVVDWKQYLAEQGFLLLACRCRCEEDIITIHSCIEKVFKKTIQISDLYNPTSLCAPIMRILDKIVSFASIHFKTFVWTPTARRLALLTGLSYYFNEPFLLVGETGLGKTTICQILSTINDKYLHIVNCHMHSEASDFIGSIRPVRSSENDLDNQQHRRQIFKWQDGPLISAMKEGQDFLIDEISLADDSVLERLNSVLEDERTILLAEDVNSNSAESIICNENFRIFGTMNPSGDFGKKELSAALRNRFTEIWCPCPSIESSGEFEKICEQTLTTTPVKDVCIETICQFSKWLCKQTFFTGRALISIRDLVRWIEFINKMVNDYEMNPIYAMIHGSCLLFIDSFSDESLRQQCMTSIIEIIEESMLKHEINNENESLKSIFNQNLFKIDTQDEVIFKCGHFSIPKQKRMINQDINDSYCVDTKTTLDNIHRILRCLQMNCPVMLEGSPGVGKTSLVETLAALTNNRVLRINLSEQTDLSELFGADLPVAQSNESNTKKEEQFFEWQDGPLLSALKRGDWIILDEINLANQSVLEGLNSCLDHRGEIYISELSKRFSVNRDRTKIFACQNPFSQGGGRKGLPKSFLNRFLKVYMDPLTQNDLLDILSKAFSHQSINKDDLLKMIQFNDEINRQVNVLKQWGHAKGHSITWEFNLRDLFRWCDLLVANYRSKPADFVYIIYAARFRSQSDRLKCFECFESIFNCDPSKSSIQVRLTTTHLQIGNAFLKYNETGSNKQVLAPQKFTFTPSNLIHLEAIAKCLEMNWMTILIGDSCVGKTTLIRMIASN
jgi:midasin